MELNMTMKQTQTLSPQMMQSMEILQMGSQELLEYVEEQMQENPLLEMEDGKMLGEPEAILKQKLEWLESCDVQNRSYHQQDQEDDGRDPISNYGNAGGEEDLYHYVLDQLETMKLDFGTLTAARFLLECLNKNGWLDEALDTLAWQLHRPLSHMEAALKVLQSLEPAGVGARNLSECLVLQLERMEGDVSVAIAIAQDYLDPLSKNRYGLIARALGVSQEQVYTACSLIRTLNPRPASGFADHTALTYINPDLFVVSFPDHFEVLTNDTYFPKLNVSNYYCRMLKDATDCEVKDYLGSKVRQAKWVVKSIEQRRSTLLQCAETLLERQEAFFRQGPGHLKPMSLADIASQIGVHESTVSRAVKDKYLQCASGVYPLSYFFSRSLGSTAGEGECTSPDGAKALLKKLVCQEDKKHPLSDQKLCQLLEGEGYVLSRRTVAKYRDELHIPCTTGRKQYE